MPWHMECRHQSNVTLSEHFSRLDCQAISEDKLHFDLAPTHHNKNTREGESPEKDDKNISNMIASVSRYHPAWLQISPLACIWANGWLV